MNESNQAEFLCGFLAETDMPCPGCGYNLRGLRAGACPECNQALVLRVGLAEPRMGLYVAGLVGLAAGAGFSGLLVLYAIVTTFVEGGSSGFWDEFLVVTGAGLVFEGALLAVWLRRGAALRRAGFRVRIGLAVAAWALTAANLTIFTLMV